MSNVLATAVALASQKGDQLSRALTAPVEAALKRSVKHNPEVLVEAIFPVLGPAIRRAVSQAIAGLVQMINQTLESALTPRGIKWRIEAWKTGKSYGEVVLAKSLVFRVEQVCLFHLETGLLLEQAMAPGVQALEPELFASMINALQDFVRDTVSDAKAVDSALHRFEVGEFDLLVERGPRAVVAAVIRGDAPADYPSQLQAALEDVHEQFGTPLSTFEGDASGFQATSPILEDCLLQIERAAPERARTRLIFTGVGVLLMVALGLWGTVSIFNSWSSGKAWREFLVKLRSEPGYEVLGSTKDAGRFEVTLLRDPASRAPGELLANTTLRPEHVHVRAIPYLSADPSLLKKRLTALLGSSPGVSLRIDGQELIIEGAPPPEFLRRAEELPLIVPGILRVRVIPPKATVAETRGRIEVLTVPLHDIPPSSAPPPERLTPVRPLLDALETSARQSGTFLQVRVTAHVNAQEPRVADPREAEVQDLASSTRWAEAITRTLDREAKWPHLSFIPEGAGSGEPLQGIDPTSSTQRRLTFRVTELPR